MSERKVLNKYYPPDFDPSKIPRMKLPKNRQYTVRLMAPFNMRCKTCGEYIYKGKKFNARKEDVENQDYLGIRIYRFYIKCTRCLQEISFKTDPRNCDYEIEAGATRNFMALKLAEEQAQREEDELREEEANNPMKLLENRTIQSKNEIELLESLEELKDLNKRHEAVDYDSMLQAYDTRLSAREIEEKLKQRDEEYIKTLKFHSSQKRRVVVEEEIVEEEEEEDEEPLSKQPKIESINLVSTSKETNLENKIISNTNVIGPKWNLSIGASTRKNTLSGLVKLKKSASEVRKVEETSTDTSEVGERKESIKNNVSDVVSVKESVKINESKIQDTNGLSMLGAYSGSDSNESD